MHILHQSVIYENPLPQLCSRQAAFPNICQLPDGTLLAAMTIGEAFESVDGATHICRSADCGRTWSAPQKVFPNRLFEGRIFTDYGKLTLLPDGRLALFGYAYFRDDPQLPLGNPITGGLLEDFVFCAFSEDAGNSWSPMQKIPCAWGPHAEASAPLSVLKDGSWISPITGFPAWDGVMTGPMCGRMLRTEDQGKTWNDRAVCMAFSDAVTCYEQRLCQLDSGVLVCIGWNENTATGERMPNHYTTSCNNGLSWSAPVSTGIRGQASSLCALGGEKLLAIHAVRRDTDKPGIYGYLVDFSRRTWEIEQELLLWAPDVPVTKDSKMADIFAFLKFGQPSVIRLANGSLLLTFWYAREGQYKTACIQFQL